MVLTFCFFTELVENITIEERVEILEGQVNIIQDEVSDIETNVNFLFDETVIQDERVFSLEEETDAITLQLFEIDDDLESEFLPIKVTFLIGIIYFKTLLCFSK